MEEPAQHWPSEAERAIELSDFDAFAASFYNSLDDTSAKATAAAQLRAKLVESKASLREAEEKFVRALREKTRKEARQLEVKELISNTKSRIEDIRKRIEHERRKRNEYLAPTSIDSNIIEEKRNKSSIRAAEILNAVKWYNNVLGFHVESGRGVKFSFANMSKQDVTHQCSFTVRFENDTYTLLECDPLLECTKELVSELNRTNGLYEFVRTMRQKFLEASLSECDANQESLMVSSSAPSVCYSYLGETDNSKRDNKRKNGNIMGELSASSVPSSLWLKGKK